MRFINGVRETLRNDWNDDMSVIKSLLIVSTAVVAFGLLGAFGSALYAELKVASFWIR